MRTGETDPIVAEVRAIRNSYAKRLNYDVAEIFRDLRRGPVDRDSSQEDDTSDSDTDLVDQKHEHSKSP